MGAPGTGTGYILSKEVGQGAIEKIASMLTPEGNAAILVMNLVYNPDTLLPELMQQPTIEVAGDLTVTMGDVEKILAGNYWKQELYDYDVSNNLIYLGKHLLVSAAETDSSWWVWKLTWGSGLVTRKQGPIISAYSNRTGLGW